MRARRLLALALAVGALVLAAWWLEVVLPDREQARRDAEEQLAPPSARLLSLDVTRRDGDDTEEISLRPAEEGGWRLESPAAGVVRADVRAVQDAERALAGARLGAQVLPADEIDSRSLEDFGLAPPLVTASWRVADDSGAERGGSIRLGRLSPSGPPYVLAPTGDVVLGPRALFDVLSRDLALWRVKRVLPAELPGIHRVEIERPRDPPEAISRHLAFARDDDVPTDWRLVVRGDSPSEPLPSSQDAADVQVESLLSKLRSLQAFGFGPESPTQVELDERELDPPWARVVLRPVGDSDPVELIVGGPAPRDGTVWARAGSGPLIMVRDTLRGDLLLPDLAYRENRVLALPRWQVDDLAIDKPGRMQSLRLRITRDDADQRAGWTFEAPVEAALSPEEAALLLRELEDVRMGRFEDQFAAEPSRHPHGDFDALGTFRIDLHATAPDGAERRLAVRVGPPFRGPMGEIFALVALEDERGHRSLGVVEGGAFDPFLEEARLLRDAAWERAAAEP